jgi:hypothetical protein
LLADAQSWFTNAATNFGWILICEDEGTPGSARRFGARESPSTAASLVIQYTQPAPPIVVLTPVADTSLFELDPDSNLGASTLVAGSIGANGSGKRSRSLIQFSMQEIPTNVVLTSATLDLTVVQLSFQHQNSNFDLRRMFRGWGEGNKNSSRGSPASPGEATWNARFFPETGWAAPGASAPVDFSSTISATTAISEAGSYSFTNLLADVQFWIDHPDQNFGWILLSESESVPYTARRFGSRESGSSPSLTVTYVARPVITRPQVTANRFNLTFAGQVGQGYLVQGADALATGTWVTLTNIPPLGTSQTITFNTAITNNHRFYRIGLP